RLRQSYGSHRAHPCTVLRGRSLAREHSDAQRFGLFGRSREMPTAGPPSDRPTKKEAIGRHGFGMGGISHRASKATLPRATGEMRRYVGYVTHRRNKI